MVGAPTKLSRAARPSHRSKHLYFVEERLGGTRISPAATLEMPPLDVFEAIQHPLRASRPRPASPLPATPRQHHAGRGDVAREAGEEAAASGGGGRGRHGMYGHPSAQASAAQPA